MNQDNFNKLTENITTKQDLVYLLDDINQAQQLIFKEGQQPLSQKAKNSISKRLRKILKSQQEQGNLQTREQQQKFLKQLKDHLQNLPQIKLTIAFSPTDSFLEEIARWLKDQTNQRVIIDLTIKPEIVGGAIIEYQGHYLNFALDKKIKELTHE